MCFNAVRAWREKRRGEMRPRRLEALVRVDRQAGEEANAVLRDTGPAAVGQIRLVAHREAITDGNLHAETTTEIEEARG